MKLYWTHILKRRSYVSASAVERRMIEIRYSVGRVLQAKRRQAHVTQRDLAARIGAAQPTISKIERASSRVSLDNAIWALLALGADDVEIADAFNAGRHPAVRQLRNRASRPLFPRPAIVTSARRARIAATFPV